MALLDLLLMLLLDPGFAIGWFGALGNTNPADAL